MSEQRPLSESLATSTAEPIDERGGRIVFRDDFIQLFRDISVETAECLIFLLENPSQASCIQGDVSTGALLNQDWEPGMPFDKAFTPLISRNVRMWAIPGTNHLITDLAGDLVVKDEAYELPSVIDLINIPTKAELEQLLAGLRTMRG